MTCSTKLSILMPVFNEQYLIRQAIEEALFAKLPEGISRELIIVDDGSTDDTPDIIRKMSLHCRH